jgi:WD40 repeat protein
VWRLESDGKGGEPVASLPGHTGWVRDIAFDEDGSGGGNLYSIGCNFIKVWGPASEGGGADGDDDTGMRADGVNGARRKDAVGGGKWGERGVGGSRLLGDLRVEGDQLRVACGGGYLFSAGIDGSLRAWRSPCRGNMGAPVKEVEGAHAGRVTGLAWADGHLYSCSHDGYVRYGSFH